MGRGLTVATEPAALGTYHGVAGDAVLTALVEESDALFLIGVIPSDTNFGVSEGRIDLRNAIHALDRRVMIKHHVYPDIPLSDLMDAVLDAAEPTRAPTKFTIGQAYPTGPGYYAGIGIRRAGGARGADRDRQTATDPGRRRGFSDDRLGARKLPPLRARPNRHPVQ